MISEELINIIDQNTNFIEFGYKLPVHVEDYCYAICSICHKSEKMRFKRIKRTFKRRGTYRHSACVARSDEGRQQRSKQANKLWSDPIKSAELIKTSRRMAQSDEGRQQRSKQSKAAWENPAYASMQKARIGEMFRSEEHRFLVAQRNHTQYDADPEKYLREKVSVLRSSEARAAHKKALASPEYRALHRRLAIERFKDPAYKQRISAGLEGFARGGNKSKPEKQIEEILTKLKLGFIYNKSVGPYNFDFYIGNLDLFIEVQGEYWHTLRNNENRDKAKYSYLRNSRPESKIIYIWDYDLLTGLAEQKISEAVGLFKFPTLDFDFSSITTSIISQDDAKKFLSSWHYAQFGKKGKFIYAAKLGEEILAIAKFGPVSRKEIATSIGGTPKDIYELDRFCIHPMRQKKNFASFFLSRATKAFFASDPQINKIVAFSDLTFGHDGSIYKACNWEEHSKVRPDYVYVKEDGWVMHKKTLYNQARSVHTTEHDYAKKNGWQKVFGKEKTKFILTRT
jgi:hypothetical protein